LKLLRRCIPRILIADDHDIIRAGVRHILETEDDWEVVGEASNGQEAIRLSEQLKPDAVVMDITMPVMNGLVATRELLKNEPNSKVLILTVHEGTDAWQSAQHSGAKGLITKSQATHELTPALKAIIAGSSYFPSTTVSC
jgi:DNA-binding NarL/FixJ family response regulator